MAYEWDEEKAMANLRKHKVDFADAVGVFDDSRALSMPEATPHEERFIAVDMDLLGESWSSSIPTVASGFALSPHASQLLRNAKPTSKVPHETRI